MSRFSDDNFTITSSSPLLHLCCDAKQRTCGFVLKLPQNTSTHHRFNRKGQVCRYKSSSHRTSAFHHLKTTTASLSAVLVLLSLLLSRFGADGARQALRYNYPRDEVNFSLSQGMCVFTIFLYSNLTKTAFHLSIRVHLFVCDH